MYSGNVRLLHKSSRRTAWVLGDAKIVAWVSIPYTVHYDHDNETEICKRSRHFFK